MKEEQESETLLIQVGDIQLDEQSIDRELPRKIKVTERRAKNNAVRFLLQNVRLLYSMLRDPHYKLSFRSKALIIGALAYFILPVDAIPDYIPLVGYVDDGTVIAAVVRTLVSDIESYKQTIFR